MVYLSRDLIGHETKTLYVIGNGFDLFHDIPSSYSHFYHWLKAKGMNDFIAKMESFFPSIINGEFLLWKDFESALGKYDRERIFNDATVKLDRKLDEETKYAANKLLDPVILQIVPLIKEWAEWICDYKLSSINPKMLLPKESWFISFNYTMTLEKIYHIPPERICHIHDSIKDNEIVVGHNNPMKIDEIGNEGREWYEESSHKSIVESMNKMVKNTYKIYTKHKDFFDKIKGIERIVILGHSMSDIDADYFGYIRGASVEDAHWHISKYSPSDEVQISKCLNKRKIDNRNRWIFNL